MKSRTWNLAIIIALFFAASVSAQEPAADFRDVIVFSVKPDMPIGGVHVVALERDASSIKAKLLSSQESLEKLKSLGVVYGTDNGTPNALLVSGITAVYFDAQSIGTAPGNKASIPPVADDRTIPDQINRVRSDMRTMATAIESYYIDYNSYPLWVSGLSTESTSSGNPLLANMPTFRRYIPDGPGGRWTGASLTTPISYMRDLVQDPFNTTSNTNNHYSYYSTANGWILASPGPDGAFNFDPSKVYKRLMRVDDPALIPFTYDPTNGTVSAGDIIRVRQ